MTDSSTTCFSTSTRQTLYQLALVTMPAGAWIAGPGWDTIDRLERWFVDQPTSWRRGYVTSTQLLEGGALARYGKRFSRLAPARQLAYLQGLFEGSFATRALLRVVLSPLKVARYDDPAIFEQLGCVHRAPPVVAPERPRYLERALDASTLDDGEQVEAEVVVVGSGAGGAAIAAELAEMGVAVAMIEEGSYWRREHFNRRPLEMSKLMYRSRGMTGTVGNCVIAIPLGIAVGGTTTINSGTCYRIPERVLAKWRTQYGLTEFTSEGLDPYYTKVEQLIQATPADPRYVGGIATVIARGCEALGYPRHGPLLRNAPDCDGASVCCFGCPTDAKRSANISYVPLALRYGANLFYNARVSRVLVESERVAGVEARTASGGRLVVRAPAVVVACGTVGTPALLLGCGLANRSGQLGRNLSIHPAVGMFGLFPDVEVRGCSCIPQGYAVEQFHDEGILFEGAFVPPDFGAGSVTFFGPRFTEVMERYENIGYFGFMIEDTSRGRVRLGRAGQPLMSYFLNDHDVARLKRGVEILTRIFLAAGADGVFPQLPGLVEVRDMRDLERFRHTAFRARDFDLTAHHPLGTARMGLDPASSVVGPDHQAHDLAGLYICDGSAVPSSIGVNPMMTIMAMATRAARHVARTVEAAR
jgi:choline dehydrogenase-like flavoprotein